MKYRPVALIIAADPSAPLWKNSIDELAKLNYQLVFETPKPGVARSVKKLLPAVALMEHSGEALETVRDIRRGEKLLQIPIFIVADRLPLDELPDLIDAGVEDCFREGTTGPIIRSRIMAATKRHISEQYAVMISKETPIRDSLTGLWNHRHFHELLGIELKRSHNSGEPVSMIMIDLDHFKWINDTFGHQAGDLCLKELTSALSSGLRAGDVIARYGGEEFAVILPSTDRVTAFATCARLQAAVQQRRINLKEQKKLSLTFSAGIAVYPDDGANMGELIHAADMAMYQAKRRGRKRVESVRPIRFRFSAKHPCEFVGVGGDWNAWTPETAPLQPANEEDPKRTWEGTVHLPTGKNRYKFKMLFRKNNEVNYLWITDPDNPSWEPDGFGGANSYIDVEPYVREDAAGL